jgi:hypothetical protein
MNLLNREFIFLHQLEHHQHDYIQYDYSRQPSFQINFTQTNQKRNFNYPPLTLTNLQSPPVCPRQNWFCLFDF